MKCKRGVTLVGLKKNISSVLQLIEDEIRQNEGYKYVMTITSARDGKHLENSKHYEGLAVDIRSFDMKYPRDNVRYIQQALGSDYDVVLEVDHIHIEYDK